MRKLELNIDENKVNEFINELQKKLPQYEINLNNANDFSIMLTEKSNCQNCKALCECKNDNKGYYTDYKDNEFGYMECIYMKENKLQNSKDSLIKTLYMPRTVLDAKIENFDVNTESRRKIFNHIGSFLSDNDEKKKGLYLYGTFSIGKTFTLSCIANELMRANKECLLIYFPDLVVDLKNAIGTGRFESLINMLKSIDVLMLDDLGSENMTPWIRDEILGPVINYRLLENKPMFISSNINPNELVNHLAIDKSPASKLKAERIISRIQGLVLPICMDDTNKYKR